MASNLATSAASIVLAPAPRAAPGSVVASLMRVPPIRSIFARGRAWRPRSAPLYRAAMDRLTGPRSAAHHHLHPPIDPFDQRMVDVGDGHRVYVEAVRLPGRHPRRGAPRGAGRRLLARDAALLRPARLPRRAVRPARLRPLAPARRGARQHHLAPGGRHRAHPRDAGRRSLDRVRRLLGRHLGADLRANPSRAGGAPGAARRVPDDAGRASLVLRRRRGAVLARAVGALRGARARARAAPT